MEIRHLKSFLVLADELHFGRAAERLHVAQPALSQQLKTLERSVGTTLLDRSTRRASLTPAGQLLRERAEQIVGAMERTERELHLAATGAAGSVSIGLVGTATYDLLPKIARRVRIEAPDIHLEFRGEMLGPVLIECVRDRVLDLAVLRPAHPTGPDLAQVALRAERLVAVVPSGHPLAGEDEIRLAELAGESFVTYPSDHRSTMYPRVLEACRAAGFVPDEVVEVGETCTLVVLVAAGLGVSLVPDSVRALRLDGVAYVPVGEPSVEVPLALVHRSEASPAALTVAAIVADVAGDSATSRPRPRPELHG